MPGKNSTLNAGRKFMDAGENRQFSTITDNLAGGDHFVNLIEHFPNFVFCFAFDDFGQERCGGF